MAPGAGEGVQASSAKLPGVEHLSSEQRRLLAYASAIGREFDFALLAAAMDVEEEPLAEEVEKLVHQGLLRERSGGDRFSFVQEELRARLYQSLTQARLRVLHRKIAEALERDHPKEAPEVVAELGRHFFLGKVPEKSYPFNRRAARLAEERNRPEEAAHHLERARIDLRSLATRPPAEEAELAEEVGNVYFSMGDVAAADRLFAEGLARAPPGPSALRARLLLARGDLARDRHEGDAARRFAREALEMFSAVGDLAGVASVHRVLGRLAFHAGAYREALDEEMQALDLLQQANDARAIGRLCTDIGNTFSMLGPQVQDDSIRWYRRAIDLLQAQGDWLEVARAYLNLGVTLGESDPSEGLVQLERAREFADRAHESRFAGWALFAGVQLRLSLGQTEEAERDNQLAGRLLDRVEDAMGRQQVEMNVGLIAERRAQWEEAERAFRGAIQQAERLGLLPEIGESEFHLARLLFKTRALPEARRVYAEAARRNLPTLKPNLAAAFVELGRQIERATAAGPSGEPPKGAASPGGGAGPSA